MQNQNEIKKEIVKDLSQTLDYEIQKTGAFIIITKNGIEIRGQKYEILYIKHEPYLKVYSEDRTTSVIIKVQHIQFVF